MEGKSSILVATDFSEPADRAMDEAVGLAKAIGASIELIHVHVVGHVPVPPTLDLATRTPSAKDVARAEADLAARAQAVTAAGVGCATYAAFGVAADEIARRAKETAPRMLVVGTHGHSALRHLLMGSTAERVVKLGPCPVLVVPPPV